MAIDAVDAVIGDCEMSWECDEDGDSGGLRRYRIDAPMPTPKPCTGGFHYSDETCGDYGSRPHHGAASTGALNVAARRAAGTSGALQQH